MSSSPHYISLPSNQYAAMEADSLGNSRSGAQRSRGSPRMGINDLPVEVLINIFSRLNPLDLCNGRVVCKKWYEAIRDKHTWTGSFSRRFGSSNVFPSVSGSSVWMTEYFTRLEVYKRWRKGIARHSSYQVLNDDEISFINHSIADFNQNRLLTFSRGDISICNLRDGKNATYIPGNQAFTRISAYSISWDYLFLGKETGGLYLKNLKTSTSSTTSRTSLITLIDDTDANLDPITCTALNFWLEKHRRDVDCIAGTMLGVVKFWNITGTLVKTLELNDPLVEIKSEFQNVAVALSLSKLYIIDIKTFEVSSIELELPFVEQDSHRLFMDVDFADSNVILSYKNRIWLYNYERNTTSSVEFEPDLTVLNAKMQTVPRRMLTRRDTLLAGSDGLLYANILSNGTVIVWNVRDTGSTIVPQCLISPTFAKLWPSHFLPTAEASTISLNSSILAVGGLNGYTNLYNVITGQFLRYCSVKFPKKLSHIYHSITGVSDILLNPDQNDTLGAIVIMDAVQYFSFGDHQTKFGTKDKKKLNVGPSNKQYVKQSIRDGMEDYDRQQKIKQEQELLLERYNGVEYDPDEELSVALAISESILSPAESNNTTASPTEGSSSGLDEDEQLRIALEKSLYEI